MNRREGRGVGDDWRQIIRGAVTVVLDSNCNDVGSTFVRYFLPYEEDEKA